MLPATLLPAGQQGVACAKAHFFFFEPVSLYSEGRGPDGTALLPGLRYNATIDERRYTPRAHLDESGERHTQKGLALLGGQEHCDRLQFHVLVSVKVDKAGVSSWGEPAARAKMLSTLCKAAMRQDVVGGASMASRGWK